MNEPHRTLLDAYARLPERLEAAIAGLSDAELDLGLETGWTIREYVHHTVEGELLWQLHLRALLGVNGMEIPMQWYFTQTQDAWSETWASKRRALAPTLALFHGSIASLVELMEHMPDEAWEHHGFITWPKRNRPSRITVQWIIETHIGHMDQHSADIHAIRKTHHIEAK